MNFHSTETYYFMSKANPRVIQVPIVHSLILCISVWGNGRSEKLSLSGIIHYFIRRKFPVELPYAHAYIELSDGRGKMPIDMKIVRETEEPQESELLCKLDSHIVDFADPRALQICIAKLSKLKFDHPGTYRLVVETQGQFVADRPFYILRKR